LLDDDPVPAMFSRVQAQGFRSLRIVDQSIGPFQALVGPNASGKTTFLDVVELMGDLMRRRGDVGETVSARSSDFRKFVWLGEGDRFRLAVEAPIPKDVRERVSDEYRHLPIARYEIEIAMDRETNELGLDHEILWMKPSAIAVSGQQRDLFPDATRTPSEIFEKGGGRRMLVTKKQGGNDNYYPHGAKSFTPSFRTGRRRAALANVPADEDVFPVSSWFRDLLEGSIQNIQLDAQAIRQPSPPGLGTRFQTDGSNLPWVVESLSRNEQRFREWIAHVRTALEDIKDIRSIERPEDRHRYLVVEYENGALVPSWLLSDGSLRLLALTILAYVEGNDGVMLIEEPENGIHPKAIETVMQSLGSVYGSQVLIATHSPVALNMLEAKDILCFAKDQAGATDIVSGDDHPRLRRWQLGEPDLGVLFASGILS